MRRRSWVSWKQQSFLGVGERTFRRWKRDRFEEDGGAGLLDRRLGEASGKRVPAEGANGKSRLSIRQWYQGFAAGRAPARASSQSQAQPALAAPGRRSPLQEKDLVEKEPRRGGAHRRKRQRRPMPGMMLVQDGSRHVWLEGSAAGLDH